MDIKNFVKETLVQIAEGVIDAQQSIKSSTAVINPNRVGINSIGQKYLAKSGATFVHDIEMEIAVTISDKEGNEGGLKVVAGVFSIGGGAKNEYLNNTISTVKFKIPMVLPVSDSENKKMIRIDGPRVVEGK